MTTRDLNKASKTTVRTAKYEWQLDESVLSAVIDSRSVREMKKRLSDIYESNEFSKLPVYRQVAVQAYFRGAADAMAKMNNPLAPRHPMLLPPAKPKAVVPVVKTPRTKSTPPPMMLAATWLRDVELAATGT